MNISLTTAGASSLSLSLSLFFFEKTTAGARILLGNLSNYVLSMVYLLLIDIKYVYSDGITKIRLIIFKKCDLIQFGLTIKK